MKTVPIHTHIINFLIKFLSFSVIFIVFNLLNIITFPFTLLIAIPFFFTLVGVFADWIIVPKHHNLPSSVMGAVFMGAITFFIPIFFNIGHVSYKGALFISLFLGIIEATLHRFIVKPYLNKA